MSLTRMQRDLPMTVQWLSQQLLAGESLQGALQRCTAHNCGALAQSLSQLSARCRAGMALPEALAALHERWAGTSLATLAIALQAGQWQRMKLGLALLQWSMRLQQRRPARAWRLWR